MSNLKMKQETTPPTDNTSQVRTAVALAYQAGEAAPTVVAKGRGLIAEEIIARAEEHGIYVHKSKEMVALLMQVELDRHIPPELYRAVAELLAWLYSVDAKDAALRALGPPSTE
jgi:flagellar biosynthesis protein